VLVDLVVDAALAPGLLGAPLRVLAANLVAHMLDLLEARRASGEQPCRAAVGQQHGPPSLRAVQVGQRLHERRVVDDHVRAHRARQAQHLEQAGARRGEHRDGVRAVGGQIPLEHPLHAGEVGFERLSLGVGQAVALPGASARLVEQRAHRRGPRGRRGELRGVEAEEGTHHQAAVGRPCLGQATERGTVEVLSLHRLPLARSH